MEKDQRYHISIVVRTLNEEENIGKCLLALNGQTLLPSEVLVVDNQSVDRTVEIAKKFESQLKYKLRVIENPIRGYSTGLNLGFEQSVCDLIGYLSADCIPESSWLKSLVNTMQEAGDTCGVVQGIELPIGESEIMKVISEVHAVKREGAISQRIEYFSNTNTLFRKGILKQFMPFVGINQRGGGEDTMMSIRFSDRNIVAMKSNLAIVRHEMYENLEEFCKRTKVHGRSLVGLLLNHPLRPRIYLNSFYWALIEIVKGLTKRNKSFLKIGYLRLKYTVLGVIGA
jgi:glycosyltransferase involved in cell wall biosynthesis